MMLIKLTMTLTKLQIQVLLKYLPSARINRALRNGPKFAPKWTKDCTAINRVLHYKSTEYFSMQKLNGTAQRLTEYFTAIDKYCAAINQILHNNQPIIAQQ